MSLTNLLSRRQDLLGADTPLFYSTPIHITRGEGVYLYAADGRRYIDMYNNVPCVGHCNPHVVEAIQRQAATLNVHSRYLHEGILDYAERLLGKHAPHFGRAIFTCTGTEANEVALNMARLCTGGRGIICTDAAYHGNSAAVGKLTRVTTREDSDPEVRAIPFPQKFRPLAEDISEAALCARYLELLDEAIASLSGVGLAAMLVCPILANEGLPDIPAGFMH